eukprot:5318334-Amphidinium_carterae.1
MCIFLLGATGGPSSDTYDLYGHLPVIDARKKAKVWTLRETSLALARFLRNPQASETIVFRLGMPPSHEIHGSGSSNAVLSGIAWNWSCVA